MDHDNHCDSLKGLSRLQRQILGVARTVNQYTHGGRVHDSGVPDFTTPLGIFAIYRIAPDIASEHAHYSRTRKVASAQAAISRGLTRLQKRGLLFYTPRRLTSNHERYGYFLSAAGLAASPCAVPEIDTALRFFGMKDRLKRWTKDEQGCWHADGWMDGKAGYSISRIYEDFDALRTIVDRSR